MIKLVRVVGFLLMAAGALVLLVWLIVPLRFVWPWLNALPWPIKLGFGAASLGLVVLMASLIWERLEDRGGDRSLRDEF
jgi:hypothetical protein